MRIQYAVALVVATGLEFGPSQFGVYTLKPSRRFML